MSHEFLQLPGRWGWVLVLAKVQSRGRMWRFTGVVVAELLLSRFLALLRARTLAFWGRGHLSGWLLG